MSLKVEIDWYHTGFAPTSDPPDFVGSGVEVTSLVRVDDQAGGSIELEYGRDQVTALAPTVAGRGSITLDNEDKRFSPRNVSSPLYGYIKPARPVRITRTATSGAGYGDTYSDTYEIDPGATHTLFYGYTDDSPINPDIESKTITLTLVDGLAYFRGVNITTPLYSGIKTGEAIGYILDAVGWPTSLRTLDAGASVIRWWWEDGTDALSALDKVLRSEGPPALLTMGTAGEIIFLDRHHRLTDTPSLTSQATWNVHGGAEPVMNAPFTYDEAWQNIVNTGTVSVDIRQPGGLEPIWSSDSAISLSTGEQRVITASTSDPFYDAVVPVLGTDYTMQTGSVNITLTRTSGTSTGIVLSSPSGAAVINSLQVRAYSVTTTHSIQVDVSDSDSILNYGLRSFPGDLPWCNEFDAEAVLETAVSSRAQPLPVVATSFLIKDDATRSAALLSRDLSERVTIVEPETALNDDFFVENIAHQFTAEFDHVVGVGVEAVPLSVSTTLVFRLDTAGQGADQGKLDSGIARPENLFILDSAVAGHRLGEGVTAP